MGLEGQLLSGPVGASGCCWLTPSWDTKAASPTPPSCMTLRRQTPTNKEGANGETELKAGWKSCRATCCQWCHTELLEVGQLAVVLAQMGTLWWQNRIPKQTSLQPPMVLAM